MPGAIDLDHIAVAVEQHRDVFPRYAGDLGGEWKSGGVGAGFAPGQLRFANGMILEVLRPYHTEGNDFLRRFLDRNGPGPHHLTFKVPDLDVWLARAEAGGYQPINIDRRDPDWQEAFLHPRAIPGVVVQVAQVGGPAWVSPAPDGWPAPRPSRPASLERITHAVRDLDEGRRLFAGLLEGDEVDGGDDGTDRWLDLAWPGPGRLRLIAPIAPTSKESEVAAWLGERRGRVHHLAFTVERPEDVADVAPRADGSWEVPPESNFGVRLILR